MPNHTLWVRGWGECCVVKTTLPPTPSPRVALPELLQGHIEGLSYLCPHLLKNYHPPFLPSHLPPSWSPFHPQGALAVERSLREDQILGCQNKPGKCNGIAITSQPLNRKIDRIHKSNKNWNMRNEPQDLIRILAFGTQMSYGGRAGRVSVCRVCPFC